MVFFVFLIFLDAFFRSNSDDFTLSEEDLVKFFQ